MTTITMPSTAHRYKITRGDLLRVQMHMLIRNRVLIAFLFVGSTILAFLDFRQPALATLSLAGKTLFVILFDAIFIAFVGTITLIPLWLMILVRKHRGVLGEHILEVTDDGLLERTDVNETVHRWLGFHKMLGTRRYLFVYVTDTVVHVVPMRSFASEDVARSFQREIERHTKAAS